MPFPSPPMPPKPHPAALLGVASLVLLLGLLSAKLTGLLPGLPWWGTWAPLWAWSAWVLLRTAGRWLGYLIRTQLLRR